MSRLPARQTLESVFRIMERASLTWRKCLLRYAGTYLETLAGVIIVKSEELKMLQSSSKNKSQAILPVDLCTLCGHTNSFVTLRLCGVQELVSVQALGIPTCAQLPHWSVVIGFQGHTISHKLQWLFSVGCWNLLEKKSSAANNYKAHSLWWWTRKLHCLPGGPGCWWRVWRPWSLREKVEQAHLGLKESTLLSVMKATFQTNHSSISMPQNTMASSFEGYEALYKTRPVKLTSKMIEFWITAFLSHYALATRESFAYLTAQL